MKGKNETLIEREKKHEEFKKRLVDDVFGKNGDGKVEMEKVTMLIWQFRDDPNVVKFLAQFVAKYSGTRSVFDGIEFYLPQLAHMIIHLEASWDDATLERFALIISQHSLHVALQLNWILQGAIEDYQPETADGKANPAYNALFYARCVKLLSNVERCVVYGTPSTQEIQKMYESGQISKEEYDQLELSDRYFNAAKIMESTTVQFDTAKVNLEEGLSDIDFRGSYLLYKRRIRKSPVRRKQWKTRYFQVMDRMLQCYNLDPGRGGQLVRAMPLEGAKVSPVEGKYSHMFEVKNQNYIYTVRAGNATDRERWIDLIREEADSKSLYEHSLSQFNRKDDDSSAVSGLNSIQLARYDFFKGERDFVRHLTDIAELLRFKDRDERKKLAPELMKDLYIPECAYIPLCNSTDTWRRLYKVIFPETRVFNTKERCPTMMFFASKRGEEGKARALDVASYLFEHLQEDMAEKHSQNLDVTVKKTQEETELISDSVEPLKVEEGEAGANGRKIEEGFETFETVQEGLEKDVDSKSGSNSISVWHEDKVSSETKKGGISHMKENMRQMLPQNIAKVIEEKRARNRKSLLDFATLPVQSVKIIAAASIDEEDNEKTQDREDEIDQASSFRAKKIVCGGETWNEKSERMVTWTSQNGIIGEKDDIIEVQGVISKSNDDLRQEVFVMQMIHYYRSVFVKEGLPIWLHTYRILSTSKTTGLIEIISNATSVDGLKKSDGFPSKGGLRQYFIQVYGQPTSPSFIAAQRNFMLSLVGYSLVSYLLGLKDRHNGNIMMDLKGHVIFIDFGFVMGMAPGNEFSLEKAPFKLTGEYLEVMGGSKSSCFADFKRLFVAGFEAARANAQVALGLVEITMYKSNFPCFTGSKYGNGISLKRFQDRLMLDVPDGKIKKKALALVSSASQHTGTVLYDKFQYHSNGYIP